MITRATLNPQSSIPTQNHKQFKQPAPYPPPHAHPSRQQRERASAGGGAVQAAAEERENASMQGGEGGGAGGGFGGGWDESLHVGGGVGYGGSWGGRLDAEVPKSQLNSDGSSGVQLHSFNAEATARRKPRANIAALR